MTTLIVLFNLKNPAACAEYEQWAQQTDLPTAGSLPSVERFEVLKAQGLLGGGRSPYQYVEIIRVKDMKQFGSEVASPSMQKIATQFQAFADKPLFLVADAL